MGHADIKTTQQYYLSVTEEHAERTSWVIGQVTMLGKDATDARVTPVAEIDDSRQVGQLDMADITSFPTSTFE